MPVGPTVFSHLRSVRRAFPLSLTESGQRRRSSAVFDERCKHQELAEIAELAVFPARIFYKLLLLPPAVFLIL